jgi:hypothetical protein
MFGFEIELDDLELDEEVDCLEFRGDILIAGAGGAVQKHPWTLDSMPRPRCLDATDNNWHEFMESRRG